MLAGHVGHQVLPCSPHHSASVMRASPGSSVPTKQCIEHAAAAAAGQHSRTNCAQQGSAQGRAGLTCASLGRSKRFLCLCIMGREKAHYHGTLALTTLQVRPGTC